MVSKIIWHGQTKRNLNLATIGLALGLFLLGLVFFIYLELTQVLGSGTQDAFLIINKKVKANTALKGASPFSSKEIETLENRRDITKIYPFISNAYEAQLQNTQLGFRTLLFFEAVPDQFVDAPSRDWYWEEGEIVPIVIARDYLVLYNFGFAPSRGLPQMTQDVIKTLPLELSLRGNGNRKTYKAQIVGFSDRINSILVPQSFLEYTNEKFGSTTSKPQRLLVTASNPKSRSLQKFLLEKDYELSSGQVIGEEILQIMYAILGILGFIGLIISTLSALTMLLAFRLYLANAKEKINLLLILGYTDRAILKPILVVFRRKLMMASSPIILVLLGLKVLVYNYLSGLGYASPWWTILIVGVLVLFGLFSIFIIIKKRMSRLLALMS